MSAQTLVMLVVVITLAFPLRVGALVCGKDLDGDGKATSQGETAECVGKGGTLCPIDAIECAAATSEPTCPDGGTLVPERDRCETPVPYWTCPLTWSAYGSTESCNEACSQASTCSPVSVTVSGSAAGSISRVAASGNTVTFYAYVEDGWSYSEVAVGSVSLTGAAASGSAVGSISRVTASENTITFYAYVADGWTPYEVAVGSIILSGATASGSAVGSISRIGASGNTLTFYAYTADGGTWHEAPVGSIGLTGMDYSCPYGNGYACDAGHNCTRTALCDPSECATGYFLIGGACVTSPKCSEGTYDSQRKQCVDRSTFNCPYGESFPCTNNGRTMQCSRLTCFDPAAPGNEINENNDNSVLQDDGRRDNLGNCLDSIYIFSGRSMECRTSGQKTGWKNCCLSGDAPLADDVGSLMSIGTAVSTISNVYHMGQIAYYGNVIISGAVVDISGFTPAVQTGLISVAQSGSVMEGLMTYAQATFLNPTTLAIAAAMYLIHELLFSGSCNQEDIETAMLESSNMCHYLTTYCKKRWPLVGCIQEAKVWCCFNSKLARIIHEQGRPQLSTFSPPWTTDRSSQNCRGFTPSEFQMLDFSKMDLSEYLGDIKTKAQDTIQNTVTDKIQQYYEKTRP